MPGSWSAVETRAYPILRTGAFSDSDIAFLLKNWPHATNLDRISRQGNLCDTVPHYFPLVAHYERDSRRTRLALRQARTDAKRTMRPFPACCRNSGTLRILCAGIPMNTETEVCNSLMQALRHAKIRCSEPAPGQMHLEREKLERSNAGILLNSMHICGNSLWWRTPVRLLIGLTASLCLESLRMAGEQCLKEVQRLLQRSFPAVYVREQMQLLPISVSQRVDPPAGPVRLHGILQY